MKLSRRTLLGHGLAIPLSISLSPFLALRPGVASAATSALAIVMNSGEASVSVIDMASRKVVRTLPTLREPSHWALSPDRSKLYIADASGNALFIVDPHTGTAIGHKVIADPYQLGFTPDHKYLVVNALRLDYVDVYRADDLTLVKRFTAGSMPSHLDFSPDARWSFNSMQESRHPCFVRPDQHDDTVEVESWFHPRGRALAQRQGIGLRHGQRPCGADRSCYRRGTEAYQDRDRATQYFCLAGWLCALRVQSDRRFAGGTGSCHVCTAPYLSLPRCWTRRHQHWAGWQDLGSLRFHQQVAVLDPVSGDYETIDVGRSPHGIFLSTQMRRPGLITAETL